jgi:ATP-dependent DNA helicase RecQ
LDEALHILNQFWGYTSFRKKQDSIIQNVLSNKDTIALLPTGGGKSICFQVPGLMQDGLCLVISPLIALMQDQVSQLKKRNINAVAITSGLSKKEIDIHLDNAIYGKTKFLYVSPERLKNKLFLERYSKMNINLIVVDEAHCISEWGYDFRPSYLEIAKLREIKAGIPFLALTATATPEVVRDIQEKLMFKEENLVSDSFERTNISYNTNLSNNKLNRIQEYLTDVKGSGIIYCATRKAVKSLCKHLLEKGFSANFYHGGLDFNTRKERQIAWINNEFDIMISTNAFGMGIDKPDVRFVLHYDIPESLEAYFQEAGRSGRDGENAETFVFYEPSDIDKLREKIDLKFPEIDLIKNVYKALGNHLQLATGAGLGESFKVDILEFCDKYELDLLLAYNSFKFLEIGGFLQLSENFSHTSKIQILSEPKSLYQYQVKNEDTNKIIQFILRTQMGVFENLSTLNEGKISKHTHIDEKTVIKTLNSLNDKDVITYIPQLKGTYITYLTERLAENNLSLPTEIYHKRKKTALSKMDSVINYLTSNRCNSQFLLEYFGEKNVPKCGNCNSCLEDNNESYISDLKDDIESYLNNQFKAIEEVNIQDIISNFKEYSQEEILACIRRLIDHKKFINDTFGKILRKS